MYPVFVLDRKFIILFWIFLSCKRIHSIYLSAADLPDDQQQKILQTSFTEFASEKDKKSLLEFYKYLLSNSKTAQENPTADWIPEQEYIIPKASNLQRYHISTPTNSTYNSQVCNESPNKAFHLKGFRAYGICPSELNEKRLPPGTIPSTLFELRCLCEGHKCSGGVAKCISVQQLVPVLMANSNEATYYKPDVVLLTVGCLCAQKIAPEAYNKQIDSLDY